MTRCAPPVLPLVASFLSLLQQRATWYNKGEIRKVVEVIKSMLSDNLLSTPPLRPAHIGVMAPWREQVWKLREELRKERLHAVDVGTVEDFQGRESRVVIISCVRSNKRFLEEDARRGLGVFHERKRMNVAITRAREVLVVVGNGELLSKDPYWKSFLQFTLRHKLCVLPCLPLLNLCERRLTNHLLITDTLAQNSILNRTGTTFPDWSPASCMQRVRIMRLTRRNRACLLQGVSRGKS